MTRCVERLGHDGDHVVAGGGCLGGTRNIPVGTATAIGMTSDVNQHIEPLPGDGETCPVCGSADGGVLTTKMGRFGAFLGCRRYPACNYVKRTDEEPIEPLPGHGNACPTCGETTGAVLTTRRSRRTRERFLGCATYPRCNYVARPDTIGDLADALQADLGVNPTP